MLLVSESTGRLMYKVMYSEAVLLKKKDSRYRKSLSHKQ